MVQIPELTVITSTILVGRFREIIFEDLSELDYLIEEKEIFDDLSFFYSEQEVDEIASAKNFEQISNDLAFKILVDRFNQFLRNFSQKQLEQILQKFCYTKPSEVDDVRECVPETLTRCPVCNYRTFDDEPAFAICGVCVWQFDTIKPDQISLTNKDISGTPLSVNQAKILYVRTGASNGVAPSKRSLLLREIYEAADFIT